MEIINRLEEIKKQKGLSIESLSKEIGVSYQALFKWLRGKAKMSNLSKKVVRDYIETFERDSFTR